MSTVVIATDEALLLGEGPWWDPIRSRVLWVDIRTGRIFSGVLQPDGTIIPQEIVQLDETVGAVAADGAGAWIIAGQECLYVRTGDGTIHTGPRILPPGTGRRLNDGKPDPVGRYLIGTLALDGPSTEEKLVQLDFDGSRRVIDDDLTLANGLAWSADGRTLYSIDTERRVVFARSYNIETGETGPRDILLSIDEGYPDGMTIDAEEHLWIAMWGIGQVRRYSPTGSLVQTIDVPAPHTSSVVFAGPDLDTLVITTATQDLSAEQLTRYPLSGRVFTTKPGVRGLRQPLWNGSQLPTHSHLKENK